jgi:hypothetical protein
MESQFVLSSGPRRPRARAPARREGATSKLVFLIPNLLAVEKEEDAALYFDGEGHDLGQYHAQKVYIDPNKRDLLYCMGSGDTKDNPQVLVFYSHLDSTLHVHES